MSYYRISINIKHSIRIIIILKKGRSRFQWQPSGFSCRSSFPVFRRPTYDYPYSGKHASAIQGVCGFESGGSVAIPFVVVRFPFAWLA